ncbi:hypothetical protein Rhe02_18770 [Rhizocola hellebori]|uniref:DUF11 domain-containing protein n=1 Tax=Rhizocola hellebori TaxID=1392758 RepID=A0A8J3Q4T0_9ACTN|nr:hypothetical protein [Rhizocola hellebori]GIH03810.1 hypothetical protein Rhe02_18770 [Rhizocola hellebori]
MTGCLRRLPRIGAAIALTVLVTGFHPARPATAAEALIINDLVYVEGPNVSSSTQIITLGEAAGSEQHPISIRVPEALSSQYWHGVLDALCAPDFWSTASERTCTPSYPSTRSMTIVYRFGSVVPELAQRPPLTVTVRDTVTGQTATATVRVVSRADLAMTNLSVHASSDSGPQHTIVGLRVYNYGPSPARSAVVRASFSGSVAFGDLPTGCAAASTVVTCQIDELGRFEAADRALHLTPGSSGDFSVICETSFPGTDPVSTNNTRQIGPFSNPGGPPNPGLPNQPARPGQQGANSGTTATDPASPAATATQTSTAEVSLPSADSAATSTASATQAAHASGRAVAWSVIVAVAVAVVALGGGMAFFLVRRRRVSLSPVDPQDP